MAVGVLAIFTLLATLELVADKLPQHSTAPHHQVWLRVSLRVD
jgi:uncharacterized membrane protein